MPPKRKPEQDESSAAAKAKQAKKSQAAAASPPQKEEEEESRASGSDHKVGDVLPNGGTILLVDKKGNMMYAIPDHLWWRGDKAELKAISERMLARKGFTLAHRPPIIFFGKKAEQPRDVGFFAADEQVDEYRFSGQAAKASPMNKDMLALTKEINTHFGSNFNAVLVNYYADGNDRIGAHGDDEQKLSKKRVAGVCWGAVRTFRIRNKETRKILLDYQWKAGTLLVMEGPSFQTTYTHEIPAQKKIKEPRISLTWRVHGTPKKQESQWSRVFAELL